MSNRNVCALVEVGASSLVSRQGMRRLDQFHSLSLRIFCVLVKAFIRNQETSVLHIVDAVNILVTGCVRFNARVRFVFDIISLAFSKDNFYRRLMKLLLQFYFILICNFIPICLKMIVAK